MEKNVTLIVDLQFGSTGKGLIAGYLAQRDKPDTVISCNTGNSGHTFIDERNAKLVQKVLPSSIVSPNCNSVMIGPGSVYDMSQLKKEVETAVNYGYMSEATIYIHQGAVPLKKQHALSEAGMSAIGSTQQGSGAAAIHKILRDPEEEVISKPKIIPVEWAAGIPIFVVTPSEYRTILADSISIIAEGAQGFSLGMNEQFYPYCTSRDCTPARFLADMAIPVQQLNKVVGTARTYPIRVGGTSGDCYDDQAEVTWEDLGLDPEFTTVTGKKRRVFTFSEKQIKEAIDACQPDEVFLNFCNYINDRETLEAIIECFPRGLVRYLGNGPKSTEIGDLTLEQILI